MCFNGICLFHFICSHFQYNETEILAVGVFHFDSNDHNAPPVSMCRTRYKEGHIFAKNDTYEFDTHVVKGTHMVYARNYYDFLFTTLFKLFLWIPECLDIYPVIITNNKTGENETKYDLEKFLSIKNKTINFDRFEQLLPDSKFHWVFGDAVKSLKKLCKHSKYSLLCLE